MTDADGKVLVRGKIRVADADEVQSAQEIKVLAAGDDPADAMAALLAYESLGAFDEGLATAERLVKLAPSEATSYEALATLLDRAGRTEEARVARARAAELSIKPR